MSVQTLRTDELPDDAAEYSAARPDTAPRALRILAATAVCLGVAALAAATFVLSYSAIRAVALQAGITPRLARGYPLLLDAMLIIVLAAVLALRGAGLPSRLLSWLTLLVVMAAAAGADALHAAGRSLPHQAAAITAAVLPWALVLIAFALLLAMLRHARLRRLASTGDQGVTSGPAWTRQPSSPAMIASHVIVQPARTVPREPGQREPAPREPAPLEPAPLELGTAAVTDSGDASGVPAPVQPEPEFAMDADAAADDPSTDEAVSEPATGSTPYPVESLAPAAYGYDADTGAEGDDDAEETDEVGPALTADSAGPDDPDMPVFHRLFSAPTPPTEA